MSPTFETASRFDRDHEKLTDQEKARFKTAVQKFIADLRSGELRAGLGIQEMSGYEGIYEFRWAPDGRATFSYGEERVPGERHVIWRRVGTHDVYRNP